MNRLLAEGLGTFFLIIAVVGSGIMGETLADGNDAIALLANSIATGAALYVLISIFGPVSGAHFNPAVTLAFFLRKDIPAKTAAAFMTFQILGGILGVWATHYMFELDILQFSQRLRTGQHQWWAEVIATFGLVLTIFGGIRYRADAVPALVALYITGAYWFTASTSFANPAVTVSRMFTDTFAGIAPANVAMFIVMQIIGAVLALLAAAVIFKADD